LVGETFTGWSGAGAGSVNSTSTQISVTSTAPIQEAAEFAPSIPIPPLTYILTVSETGLPAGLGWTFSTGSTGVGSTTATASVAGLNGTYTVTVPSIRIGTGAMYVSNWTNRSESVTSNLQLDVGFSEQYYLSIVAGTGGAATPGSRWFAAGASVTLQATAATGSHFVGWSGTGVGNYTGSDPYGTVTMNASVTEMADFAPDVASTPTPTGGGGSSIPSFAPWALLAVLLIVGIVVGVLLGRRSSPPPPASTEESTGEAPTDETPAPESAPAEYDESS
jgi:hypothetical protein